LLRLSGACPVPEVIKALLPERGDDGWMLRRQFHTSFIPVPAEAVPLA
jgi:hypothetical protein